MAVTKTQLVMTSLSSVEDPVALSEAIEMVALRVRQGQRDGVLTMASMADGSTTNYAWSVMQHEFADADQGSSAPS